MEKAFFNPFVGNNYQQGINGKKILVVGASFYCPHTSCRYFSKCTDTCDKDSSSYDLICPIYKNDHLYLHDEPSNSIGNEERTYTIFANGMSQFVESNDYKYIWNRLAFTNYVQFILPSDGVNFRPTNESDLSDRDFYAFIDVVKRLRPDIVIVWGCVINSRLKEKNEYVIDKELLPQNEWYLCHMRIPKVNHDIAIVNPNHPSSSAWNTDKEKFLHYFKKALEE